MMMLVMKMMVMMVVMTIMITSPSRYAAVAQRGRVFVFLCHGSPVDDPWTILDSWTIP
jgi:hypothetical protein